MQDVITKQIELNAPQSRVWRALTNHDEFGQWFQVKIDSPFVAGQISSGHITYPGYEHLSWKATIKTLEPEHLFSFTWHPYAIDPAVDYSNEPQTLVEFRLNAPAANRTLLTVTESGFSKLPAHRYAKAFHANEGGWGQQMKNIEKYVAQSTASIAR